MKVSIITVCFNSEKTISDTIRSIAIQDYPDIEHIIVDGGSTDDTLEIISKAKSVTKYISEPDNGIYDAMNKGISMATGDVIGMLNADDFYAAETAISLVADAFLDKKIDISYADLVYVAKDVPSQIVRYWKSKPFVPGLFKHGWMPAHPTFFVRRHYFYELGKYDLNFKLQSDFELTMRYLEVFRLKTVYLPVTLIKMRMGGASNQSVKNVVMGNIEAYKACKKNNLNISIFFSIIKIMSRLPQFWRRPV